MVRHGYSDTPPRSAIGAAGKMSRPVAPLLETSQPRGPYTKREEIAHYLTHGSGIAASLLCIPWLVLAAAARADAWRLVGGMIFCVSALLVFTTSTFYHAVAAPRAKRILRTLDHCAIYLLIAGTYTPFTIGVLRGAWGWTLFGLVWGLALVGIMAKLTVGLRFPRLSTLLYVGMGWLGVIAVRPLVASLTLTESLWLLAGGLAYTAGVPFYLWKSRRYTHAVWHVFVLVGASCHCAAVFAIMTAAGATGLHP